MRARVPGDEHGHSLGYGAVWQLHTAPAFRDTQMDVLVSLGTDVVGEIIA